MALAVNATGVFSCVNQIGKKVNKPNRVMYALKKSGGYLFINFLESSTQAATIIVENKTIKSPSKLAPLSFCTAISDTPPQASSAAIKLRMDIFVFVKMKLAIVISTGSMPIMMEACDALVLLSP